MVTFVLKLNWDLFIEAKCTLYFKSLTYTTSRLGLEIGRAGGGGSGGRMRGKEFFPLTLMHIGAPAARVSTSGGKCFLPTSPLTDACAQSCGACWLSPDPGKVSPPSPPAPLAHLPSG